MTVMFQDKYVFAQLTAFLNRTQFNNYVRKYDGNRYVKYFTCWNQLLCLILSISLMDKTPLPDLFKRTDFNNVKELDCPLFPGLFD